MKFSGLVLLLSAAVASAGLFTANKEEEGVLVLDEGNFNETIAAHETGILVEFYAPWCGHCKKLAPEYKKAAAVLGKLDPPLHLAMVDATEERELAERYGVRGFPTLKFIRNGDATDYEGGRTEKDIVSFMKKKTGPPAQEVKSKADLDKIVSSNEVLLAAYLPDSETPAAKLFLEVAATIDDYEFFYSTSSDVISDAAEGTMVLFKDFDEGRNDFSITAETTKEQLVEFIAGMSMPKVMEFSQDRTKAIFRGPIKVHMLTFVDIKADYMDEIKSTLDVVADMNRGKMLHIYVPSKEQRVIEYFGFKTDDLPKTVIADMRNEGAMKKFLFEGDEHTVASLKLFETDFFDGALKPTLKSEDDKPSNMKDPVKVIVGNSFEKHVLKSKKDVLLEFYAPWCGHCKSLAPKYEELAEKFKDVDSVYIAKMDATANEIDHPNVDVKGFPTIYFFPSGGEPEQYEGAREVDAFVKYLQTHATTDFSLEDGAKGGPGFKDEL